MADDSKKLEKRLVELGERLASPPSSVDELYELLDQIDGLLSSVEQSPSQTMLTALRPLMASLAVKDLLRHSDSDVKVVVASCVSEITRITAPEAPYDDDNMKEIFQVIVETFGGLDNTSSRSFQKRVSILETVSKVRSCVVMLDLECDALILEMFRNFLKTIRAYHSENVFSCMEIIMTLVIEESEDISPKLLSILLDTLRNDRKDVRPIAQRLAEKIMGNCATKIKPCLLALGGSKVAPLSEYDKVVASICQENDKLDQHGTSSSFEVVADVNKVSERTSSDGPPQASAKLEHEAACHEKVGTAADTLPVAAVSNGTIQMGNGDSIKQPSSPKPKPEHSCCNGQSANVVSDHADSDNLESIDVKPYDITDIKKEKGQKTNPSARLTEMADHYRVESHKGSAEGTSSRDCCINEADSLEVDDTSTKEIKQAVSSETEKNELHQLSGPDNPTVVALPSLIGSPRNSARPRKGRTPGPKAIAERGDVDAKADLPAFRSVLKDPSLDSHTQDEVMTSNVDVSERKPEDADDVEMPMSLPSDSAVKPRKGRPPGSKANTKRGDVDAKADPPAFRSVQKDASIDNHTHDEMMTPKVESERKPEDAVDVEMPLSSPSDSAVKPRKGRPPGSKANAKRGNVDPKADPPAFRYVQKDPSVDNRIHYEMMTSNVYESERKPEDADNVETPASLPSDSAVKPRKGRPPAPKANAKRGNVGAKAELPAFRSVQKNPKYASADNHTHDEMMTSNVDESDQRKPEDADVKTPASLPSDSSVKSRSGNKGRFKKKDAVQESSGRNKSNRKLKKEKSAIGNYVDGEPSLKELLSSSRFASRVRSGDKTHLDDSIVPKSRRKRVVETEDIFGMPEHKKEVDVSLVGSKIKVWWPDDEMFYDGIVDSYDPDTKKHKIVYADGDVEVLLLKDEHWKYVEADAEMGGGKRKAKGNASQTPQTKKPKASQNSMPEQPKSHEQYKSGPEASDKGSQRPRGRPKKGTSDLGKLSYDDPPEASKKSRGKASSNDKATTPSSNLKLKDVAETEPEVKTPRTSSRLDEPGNKSKDSTSKISETMKDVPSKYAKKSKSEMPKAITKLKVYTSKGRGKSREDTVTKDSTPRTAIQSKADEVTKNRTPKTGSDSKASSVSDRGKTEVEENENEAPVSDGNATAGGKKRKRKVLKVQVK